MYITPPGRPHRSAAAFSWTAMALALLLSTCSPQEGSSEITATADAGDSTEAAVPPAPRPSTNGGTTASSEEAVVLAPDRRRAARVARLPDFNPSNAPTVERTAPSTGAPVAVASQQAGESRRSAAAIRASGLFTGPGRYPPREFAAYGILAFPSGPTAGSMDRYLTICQGYIAAIPAAASLTQTGVELDRQMVTVWPLQEAGMADELNASRVSGDQCPAIVASIDIVTSMQAIRAASASLGESHFNGPGPFLIGWSPGESMGRADAPVLLEDLSNVINDTQAILIFDEWKRRIERSPELWDNGWSLERLRLTLRLLADKYGTAILEAIGG